MGKGQQARLTGYAKDGLMIKWLLWATLKDMTILKRRWRTMKDLADMIEKMVREHDFKSCRDCAQSEDCQLVDAVCIMKLKQILRGES